MVNSLLNPSNTNINLLQDNSVDLQSNCVCADNVLRGFLTRQDTPTWYYWLWHSIKLSKKVCSLQEISAYVTERRNATMHYDVLCLKLRPLNGEGNSRWWRVYIGPFYLTVSEVHLVDGWSPSWAPRAHTKTFCKLTFPAVLAKSLKKSLGFISLRYLNVRKA